MKNLLLVGILFFLSLGSYSQLSNKHWLPPLHARTSALVDKHYVYLSTPSSTPVLVTIKKGNGIELTGSPFTISQGVPMRVFIGDTQPSPMFVDINDVNAVINDKGLILEGTGDFYVSFRVRSQSHAEILVSKGTTAKGNNFRLGSVPQLYDSGIRNFVSSFMATEDNTTVNLSDYDPNVVFVSGTGNITLDNQSFVLNKGQSVVVSGYSNVQANLTGFIGALLTSDKPIVVNTGNATGGAGPQPSNNNSGQDFDLDQIVPFNQVGKKYIVVRGNGSQYSEKPLVIATEDNTQVFVNGTPSPLATLNAGEYYLIPSSFYNGTSNKNMFIESDKPVYLYQILAGTTNDATSGLNFIPPLSCYWQKSVDLIPEFNKIGDFTYSQSEIIIVTVNGSQVSINNNPITTSPQSVLGNIGWETYRVAGLTGNIKVESTGALAVGVFGTDNNAAGFGGYFSGFGSDPEDTNITICSNSTIDLLDAIEGNPFEGGNWTPALTSGTNMFNANVDLEGTYTYNYTVTCDGFSVPESVNINVTFQQALNPGTNTTKVFCNNESAMDLFPLLNTTNTSGTWSFNGNPRPNGIVNPNTDLSGIYTYTLPSTGFCDAVSAFVEVTIKSSPTLVNTITDLETCDDAIDGDTSGETLFILTDKDEQITNSEADLSVNYYELLTDAENNNTNNISSIRAVTGKTIFFRLYNTVSNCFTISSFNLVVNPLPTVNSNVTLKQCDDNNDAITSFNLTEANSLISTNSDVTFTYHNSQFGAENKSDYVTDEINYVVPNGSNVWVRIENNTTGCYRVTNINLVVSTANIMGNFPLKLHKCDYYVDVNNTDIDGIDVFDLTEIITYINDNNTFPVGQTFTYSYYETQQDALAELNPIQNPDTYTNITPHSQDIWVRIDSDLNNECYGLSNYIRLIVDPLPDTDLGEDFILCLDPFTGTGQQLLDATPETAGNYSYQWSSNITSLDLSGETNATYLVTQPGTYSVLVKNTITECEFIDSVTTTASSEPMTFTAEVTTPAFSENNVTIVGTSEGGYGQYEYSLDGVNWQENNTFTNLPSDTYTVYVRDLGGCGMLSVTNLFAITYPYYFTPNGDGYNDTWKINHLDDSYNAQIFIYDRYGKLLKQISPNGNGWNGTYNGQLLPASDYWFRIEYTEKGQRKEFKSHFSLKR